MLKNKENRKLKVVIYVVCILLAIISIMPFYVMFINSAACDFISAFQIYAK